ncbi:MAG: amino acid adenylation domain-containing protein, partial [Cyclobacteriaceae bacterium]
MNKFLVHSVFDNTAASHKDKVAIEFNGSELSYGKLNEYTNKLANLLREIGVEKEEVVGVYLPSCTEHVVSIIGINKSGGAFMPLGTNTPEKRMSYLLNYVRPKRLITSRENLSRASELVNTHESLEDIIIISVDDNELTLETCDVKGNGKLYESISSELNFEIQIDGDATCYIIYTSGSTGTPKVIEGRHKSLSHFIHWEIEEFGIDSNDKISQFAPNTFDVSLRDIFIPLLAGGTLCIPDEEKKSNSYLLVNWIVNSGLTLIHCVPSLFRLIIEELKTSDELREGLLQSLKYFVLGGDALYGRDIKNWRETVGSNQVELVNIYGPSETTLAKLFNRIGEQEDFSDGEIVPLGWPISNTSALILNDRDELCNQGETGRLFIKTPFRSKGYYKDEQLTKEKFVQNPLHNDFEDILYNTGDLASYLEGNKIKFLGRADNQVKINGNRVELFEIESNLATFEFIEEAFVGVVEKEAEKVIVAYYKALSEVKTSEVNNYLDQSLPKYMHPAHYVKMEEFPLNSNGKIDRGACNAKFLESLSSKSSSAVEAEILNEEQIKLKDIFEDVLKLDAIGINDSFFDLGGTSLKGIRIISRVYKEFGVLFKLPDLFANPTLSEFNKIIIREKGFHEENESNAELSPIQPIGEEQPYYEVSHAQKRLWLLHQFEDGRMAYNVPSAFILKGDLNVEALQSALSEIVKRHEVLRTSFIVVDGLPKQKINDNINSKLNYIDLCDANDQEEKVNDLIINQVSNTFELDEESLLKTFLIKLSDSLHVFAYVLHHIISDGWSSGVFFKELQLLYKSYSNNESSELEPLRIQYKDYAKWQNDQLTQEGANSHKEYWYGKFRTEVPTLELPADFERPEIKTYNGENQWTFINQSVFDKLKDLSKGRSLYTSLMAALKVLLYKYTDQTDIVIGAAVNGREYEDLHNQIGFYVNTLALRTEFSEEDSFNSLLEKVDKTILEGYEHEVYPFDKLVDDLELKRDTSRNPLFDVMVTYINESEIQLIPDLEGIEINSYNTNYKVSKFDLTFTFVAYEKELEVLVNYNTDLFHSTTIDRLLNHFTALLTTVL